MNQLTQEQIKTPNVYWRNQMTEDFNCENLLKEDKIIFTFPVLWCGWECDGTARVMEKDDSTRYLQMTNHGAPYVAETQELKSKIEYYKSVIQDSEKALELLS